MSSEIQASTVGGFIGRVSGYVAEALRYWEPRRLFYNGILLAVVIGHIVTSWQAAKSILTINLLLFCFFLAVLANV